MERPFIKSLREFIVARLFLNMVANGSEVLCFLEPVENTLYPIADQYTV